MLDQMTAPPAQYPAWFTAATTDPKHKDALGETQVKLAAGASGKLDPVWRHLTRKGRRASQGSSLSPD
jgi:hypothetical protein